MADRHFCASDTCHGAGPVEEGQLHYGCALRDKGIQVPASAIPTRVACRTRRFRPIVQPSWEKGVAGETRPDGSFMPYLGANRDLIRVKEAGERRHDIETQVARLKSDPTVFSSERTARL